LVVCGSEYPESDDFLILRSASLLEKRRDLGPERLPGLPFPFEEFLEVALLSDADKVAVNGFPCSWSILQMWVKPVERYIERLTVALRTNGGVGWLGSEPEGRSPQTWGLRRLRRLDPSHPSCAIRVLSALDYAAWLQTTEIQDIEADRTRRTIG
jgi:hypothetical protein